MPTVSTVCGSNRSFVDERAAFSTTIRRVRRCGNCQVDVPDASETCQRCGAVVPRGFFASLLTAVFGKRGDGASPPPPASSAPRAAGNFRLEVEDVFSITGRGTVVTGRISSGEVRVGDEVRFQSSKGTVTRTRVVGVEMFRKVVDAAKTGDDVGLLLAKVGRDDVARGAVIESA